jgi:glutamyl-tRNA(Gln) amidotransferase subunit E
MLSRLVELEVQRQEGLVKIRAILLERGITPDRFQQTPQDVTGTFANTESKVIRSALESGGVVLGVKLPGFAGLVGQELQPERRFGTELSDYARFWGAVGGIFHTDELPKYGITSSDVANLRTSMNADDVDAVVIVAAAKRNCEDALKAVLERAQAALEGVTAETRTPLADASSKYARPRPGAQRMYPETDVRPVKVTTVHLKAIARDMPESLESKEERFVKEYSLSREMASQMVRSLNLDLFEKLVKVSSVSPKLVATTLENTMVSLQRDGIAIDSIDEEHLRSVFQAVSEGKATPEGIPTLLTELAANPSRSLEELLAAAKMGAMSREEAQSIIQNIVDERQDFIREQGEDSIGGLMGIVMKEIRGRLDGKTVKDLLFTEVKRVLAE